MKDTCIKNKNKPALICFAGIDWWYHNKALFSAQVIPRLTKYYKVLFVNSVGMRMPSLKEDSYALKKIMRKLRSLIRFLRRTDGGMYVFTPVSLPFFGRPIAGPIMIFFLLLQIKFVMKILSLKNPVFYVACPTAWEVVKKLDYRHLVYQRTDIYEEMPGANKSYIVSLDNTLTRKADLVLFVNTALWQKGKEKNINSILLGHGVDFKQFANAEQTEYVPEDISKIPKPIIGFFGDITEDVCDFSLIEHIAKTLPDMAIVLVGPISADVSLLNKYENIFFLGQKVHNQIPHYGKMFDVAIMPWKQNKWIEFCNPVKTKEYLALGKPVVSIDYPELKPYADIVYSASNYDEFVNMIQKALSESGSGLKEKRRQRVQNETWDNKVKQIVDFMENNLQLTENV